MKNSKKIESKTDEKSVKNKLNLNNLDLFKLKGGIFVATNDNIKQKIKEYQNYEFVGGPCLISGYSFSNLSVSSIRDIIPISEDENTKTFRIDNIFDYFYPMGWNVDEEAYLKGTIWWPAEITLDYTTNQVTGYFKGSDINNNASDYGDLIGEFNPSTGLLKFWIVFFK